MTSILVPGDEVTILGNLETPFNLGVFIGFDDRGYARVRIGLQLHLEGRVIDTLTYTAVRHPSRIRSK